MTRRSGLLAADGVNDISPVKISVLKSVDKNFRSGKICGDGNIVNVTEPEKVILILLVFLGIHRISEEKEKVDLIACDSRTDLLISALISAEICLDLKACGVAYQTPCCCCGTQVMT